MWSVGKEVEGTRPLEDVAQSHESREVPGQRGRVAGDVDHALGTKARDPVDDPLVKSGAGRIHDDHLGRPRLVPLAQQAARLAETEAHVLDAVARGVAL